MQVFNLCGQSSGQSNLNISHHHHLNVTSLKAASIEAHFWFLFICLLKFGGSKKKACVPLDASVTLCLASRPIKVSVLRQTQSRNLSSELWAAAALSLLYCHISRSVFPLAPLEPPQLSQASQVFPAGSGENDPGQGGLRPKLWVPESTQPWPWPCDPGQRSDLWPLPRPAAGNSPMFPLAWHES